MNTEQKAQAYDSLLKAIEDKRLAVVPRSRSESCKLDVLKALDSVFEKDKRSMGGVMKLKPTHEVIAIQVCRTIDREFAISAVDQQEILKELQNDK